MKKFSLLALLFCMPLFMMNEAQPIAIVGSDEAADSDEVVIIAIPLNSSGKISRISTQGVRTVATEIRTITQQEAFEMGFESFQEEKVEGLIDVQGVFVPQDLLDKLGLDFGIPTDIMDSFSDKPGDINDLTSDLWTDKTGNVPGEFGLIEWVNSSKDAMVSNDSDEEYIINEWTHEDEYNGCKTEMFVVLKPSEPGGGTHGAKVIYRDSETTCPGDEDEVEPSSDDEYENPDAPILPDGDIDEDSPKFKGALIFKVRVDPLWDPIEDTYEPGDNEYVDRTMKELIMTMVKDCRDDGCFDLEDLQKTWTKAPSANDLTIDPLDGGTRINQIEMSIASRSSIKNTYVENIKLRMSPLALSYAMDFLDTSERSQPLPVTAHLHSFSIWLLNSTTRALNKFSDGLPVR